MKNILKKYILGFGLILLTKNLYSQINPMNSAYFSNPYLFNPALAGISKGVEFNGALKSQWSKIDGAPIMKSITVSYGSENKNLGLGLSFYSENSGIFKQSNYKATYAYHLNLNNEESFIDFGLSAGISDEWIDFTKVNANTADNILGNFNHRKPYFDGDFGLALRHKNFNIQGALPNLKRLFNSDPERIAIEKSTYFAAISYQILNPNAVISKIEPKLIYRGIKRYNNWVDLGVNVQILQKKLDFQMIYHSGNSVSGGIGTNFNSKLSIFTMYTSNTSRLQNYSNGTFEASIKYEIK